MALDENGRPSTQVLLLAMKRDYDEQMSRLNDNRVFLIAMVDELSQENAGLRAQLTSLLEEKAAQREPVTIEHDG